MNKLKIRALWLAVIGLGVVGVAGVVAAYSYSAQNVIENSTVNIYNSGSSSQPSTNGSEVIGTASNASEATHLTQYPPPTAIGGDSGLYSKGPIEVDGASYLDGRVVQGGAVLDLTAVATSTLTAAQVFSSSRITVTPVSTTPTITFPATSTLFTYLTANGQSMVLSYGAVTTSSILAAGTGGTLLNSSATTVAAGKSAFIFIQRVSSIAYIMYVINLVN